jgi:predicted kinase
MNIPRLVVMCGLPRSGKTSIARFLVGELGFEHVCADTIRDDYGIQWRGQDPRKPMVNLVVRLRAIEALAMGRDVVVDTTGMFRQQRALFLDPDVLVLGKRQLIRARRYLLSLEITHETWKQRQQASGRDPAEQAFYLQRFEPVGPEEARGLDAHLRFDNDAPEALEQIKVELTRIFAAPPPAA